VTVRKTLIAHQEITGEYVIVAPILQAILMVLYAIQVSTPFIVIRTLFQVKSAQY
jgi:hypothetical protein